MSANTARWAALLIWSAIMFYSLVIFSPIKSHMAHLFAEFFKHQLGLPGYTPAKLFHVFSHIIWTLLFLGALANGYRRMLSVPKRPIFLITSAFFVAIPELLQVFNPDRSPSFMDIVYNSSGILLGVFIHERLEIKKQDDIGGDQAAHNPSPTRNSEL